LLGVVRIHDGKQKSLMHDCSDALVKIKLAFRPGTVDQPARNGSNVASITMQETFEEDEFDQYDAVNGGFDENNMSSLNMGTAEEITLPEDNLSAIEAVAPEMEGFGEDTFGAVEPMPFLDETGDSRTMDEMAEIEVGRDRDVDQSFAINMEDGFGTPGGGAKDGDQTLDADLVEEIPQDQSMGGMPNESGFGDDFGFGDNSFANPSDISAANISRIGNIDADDSIVGRESAKPTPSRPPTRFGDEIEALDATHTEASAASAAGPGGSAQKVAKRKRKILIDQSLEIPSAEMRKGLEPHGPDDITRQVFHKKRGPYEYDRLPFSDEMHAWRLQDNSAEAMLTRPCMKGMAPALMQMFTRNFVTTARPDAAVEEEAEERRDDDIELGRDPDQRTHDYMPEDIDLPPIDMEAGGPAASDLSAMEAEPIPDDTLLEESRFDGDVSGLDQTINSVNGSSTVASSAFDFAGDGEDRLVTAGEFEDEHVTKRTKKMMTSLRAGFGEADEIRFSEMAGGKNRRVAAACLFELLVLKTKDFIQVHQPEPYADIVITPTEALMVSE
jgi:cohesin complex subunit SCC1